LVVLLAALLRWLQRVCFVVCGHGLTSFQLRFAARFHDCLRKRCGYLVWYLAFDNVRAALGTDSHGVAAALYAATSAASGAHPCKHA